MREETQQDLCVYCKKPIEPGRIFRRLPTGEKAHLDCYVDHTNDKEKPPDK